MMNYSINEGANLYRHYQFDGTRIYVDGVTAAYTRPGLSVAIGSVGSTLSGAQVVIQAGNIRNVDTSAGSAANIVGEVQLTSGATPGNPGATASASGAGASASAGVTAAALTGDLAGQASDSGAATAEGAAVGVAMGRAAAQADAIDAAKAECASAATANGNMAGAVTGLAAGSAGASAGVGTAAGTALGLTTGMAATQANASGAATASGHTARAVTAPAAGSSGVSVNTSASAVLSGGNSGAASNLPKGGLFSLAPDPGSHYLYETRPAFANHREWLSSDYLVKALALDPNNIQKRLGDGFYEQQLINQQVAELTGRRYLSGYASDDTQYAALMSAGATFAQQYGLRPGIALSAAQMATLTSDIVWLQTQTVTLADGNTQDVLVPKVYVAQAGKNAVRPSGALITGDDVQIDGDTVVNRGGTLGGSGAKRLVVVASADLVNQGGVIRADAVSLKAGGDIVNETLTQSQTYGQNDARVQAAGSITSLSNIGRIEAGNALVIDAGRDVVDTAGRINAGGTASITAGRDLKFDALTTGSNYQAQIGASSMTGEATQANVGQVTVGKDLQMVANRDLVLNGTQATAGNNVSLAAGRNVTVDAATSSQASDQRGDPAGTSYRQTREVTTVQGASVKAGGNLVAQAGTKEVGDLTVTGSQLQSNGLTSLHASGNVVIDAARETSHRDDYTNVAQSGLLSKKTTVEHEIKNSDTAVRSSISGALTAITAGRNIDIEGARI